MPKAKTSGTSKNNKINKVNKNTDKQTYRRLLVNGFDHKLFVVERDVPDLTPGKSNLWGKPANVKKRMRNKNIQEFQ